MMFFGTFVFVLAGLYLMKAQEDCLKLGIHFYEDIGCPKKENGTGCPSFEGCKYEVPLGVCLYRGQKVPVGQSKPRDFSCTFPCACAASNNSKGSFVCAQGGCTNWGMTLPPGCHYTFALDNCCAAGSICETIQPIATCTVDGKVYREGEVYVPKDKCLICRCNNGDGQHNATECRKLPCNIELREAHNLEKNCAPVYYQRDGKTALCCPQTIICPSKDDVLIEDKPIPGGKTCKYGDQIFKQGRKIQRVVKDVVKQRTVSCECLSPPWLTCSAEY